jgi:hypothetical protein
MEFMEDMFASNCDLSFSGCRETFACRVVWRRATLSGVVFVLRRRVSERASVKVAPASVIRLNQPNALRPVRPAGELCVLPFGPPFPAMPPTHRVEAADEPHPTSAFWSGAKLRSIILDDGPAAATLVLVGSGFRGYCSLNCRINGCAVHRASDL